MPAYNLPEFIPLPPSPQSPTFQHDRIPIQKEPQPQKKQRVIPSPLNLGTPNRIDSISEDPADKARTSPATIRSPHTKQWLVAPLYHRSPLSPSAPSKPIRHLSRRYLPSPTQALFTARSPIQQHISIPMSFRRPYKDERMYEEIITRVLERRLREKCARGERVGSERAGLGVSGGREIRLLAALGRVRENKQRYSLASPNSAPPTQTTFQLSRPSINPHFNLYSSSSDLGPYPGLRRDPPPALANAAHIKGHRKSSSISSSSSVASEVRPSLLYKKAGLGISLPLADTIREFVNRRGGEVVVGEKEATARKLASELVLLEDEKVKEEPEEEASKKDVDENGGATEQAAEDVQATVPPVAFSITRAPSPVNINIPSSKPPSPSPPPQKYFHNQGGLTATEPARTSRPPSPALPLPPPPFTLPTRPPPVARSVSGPLRPTSLAMPSSPAPAFIRRRSDSSSSSFAEHRHSISTLRSGGGSRGFGRMSGWTPPIRSVEYY